MKIDTTIHLFFNNLVKYSAKVATWIYLIWKGICLPHTLLGMDQYQRVDCCMYYTIGHER